MSARFPLCLFLVALPMVAQPTVAQPMPAQPMPAQPTRQAAQLDLQGKGPEARKILDEAAASAPTPRAKVDLQRAMAISWAFEGNCARAEDRERVLIGYWTTREQEDPANAFYQEGEMADELARICIDSGDLARAQAWYRKGHEYGLKEPNISQDLKALWDFRLEHAEARIAARKNDAVEAQKHIAAAQAALDRMTTSKTSQQAFVPYLTGYVAFYLGDYNKALTDLAQASQNDPFIQCLLGQTYEKLGQKDKALDCYRKAAAATAHNPPAAYAVPFARKKLS